MTNLLLSVLLLIFAATGPEAVAAPGGGRSAVELYDLGLRQMRRGNYTKALESFNRVRNYHRDDPVSVQAQLAIAELHFKKKDFEAARYAYEEFAALHPRHKDLDLVVYRMGLSIYKRASKFAGRDQTATRSAVNVWTGFDSRFPKSDYLPEVTKLLGRARDRLANKELWVARFYARKESWGAVRGRSTYMLRRYPDASNAPLAMALQGEALHSWGFTEEAARVQERLAEVAPGSAALRSLNRAMSEPPGSPPDEKVFIRPYRIRGALPPPSRGTQ